MDKIKSFIREVFNPKRIDMCLEVFTIFILVPIGILTILVSLIAAMVFSIGLVKTIVGIIFFIAIFICVFLLGVILSLIYTIYSKAHNKGIYKDEYFYEDIDYEDEDKDK